METAEQRKHRIEQVARLAERLHSLEDLLSHESDPQRRETYESEKTVVMEALRKIRHP